MSRQIVILTDGAALSADHLARLRAGTHADIVVVENEAAEAVLTIGSLDVVMDLRKQGRKTPYAKAAMTGSPFTLLLEHPGANLPIPALSRRQTHFLNPVGNHPDLLMLRIKFYGMKPSKITLSLNDPSCDPASPEAFYGGLRALHTLLGANDMREALRGAPLLSAHPAHGSYRLAIGPLECQLLLSRRSGQDSILAMLPDGSEFSYTLQSHRPALADLATNPRCWLGVQQALQMDALAARTCRPTPEQCHRDDFDLAV